MSSSDTLASLAMEKLPNKPKQILRKFQKRNVFIKLIVFILLIITILITVRSDTSQNVVTTYFSSNGYFIPSKNDLVNVDISKKLKSQKLNKSPLSEKVLNQYYEKYKIKAIVPNIDLEKVGKKYKDNNGKNKLHNDQPSLTYEKLPCSEFEYEGTIEYSKDVIELKDDLIDMRRKILKDGGFMSKLITVNEEKNWSDEEIVEKSWKRFGESPVWLESEQCYISFTRVLYSRIHQKTFPYLSLIKAQAFDKDWNEIIGKKIPFNDVSIPEDVERELESLSEQFQENVCDKIKDSSAHEQCLVKHNKSLLEQQRRKEKILSRYFQTYPKVFEIPFKPERDYGNGAEDPHVILKKTDKGEEPVVIYNLFDHNDKKRKMYALLPQKKVDPIIEFKINGREAKDTEKNWTPFFNNDEGESEFSNGSIHFIYSFKPLEILRCSLTDGLCDVVYEKKFLDLDKEDDFSSVHGGSQFVPLPNVLPKVKDQNIWVGFAKMHLQNSGCNPHYYRPMLMLMIENKGIYHLEMTVPIFDFNFDVPSWDMQGTYCDRNNILAPHSIAYWEVVSQDPETKEYEDYMALTLSESDAVSKVIVLKGILNYVIGMYEDKNVKETFVL
ncbi:uncharacterized protein NDAI_0J00920 [Naumovozyma dairenensis CBS 421]|uniref:Glycosyltransferase family 91 protein n=1 Tax=Naumovozyma dairenensis (strain ATCC 10597 / BCRC 20456 / CBS 421 / NBRC 0211 / NRRL Y-12639) TaxID=1071378 RepID=G0WGQ6_NAUDC|nr:hypothetical protein NDAI_0J00920 [Naumovozyma dairenensis CBS 421]CCD26984.1 hypothetical protein NDAI_0J00920 [Naumovozyma dairenensis CBS 421]